MRKVLISATVREKIHDLEYFLRDDLKLSKSAATKRCDRMIRFLTSLASPGDYAPCRFRRWRRLGYRCVPFEKSWVFAYEAFAEGVIIRDMAHAAALH